MKMDMCIYYVFNHQQTQEQNGTHLCANKISVESGFFSGHNDFRIFYTCGNMRIASTGKLGDF